MSRTVSLDLQRLLTDLKTREFYGKVEIEIARGEPKVLRVAETHLLSEEQQREHRSNH